MTPPGGAVDISTTWKHARGYELSITVCRLDDDAGFTLRSTVTNNSDETVRIRHFVVCKTSRQGLVCQGDPAIELLEELRSVKDIEIAAN